MKLALNVILIIVGGLLLAVIIAAGSPPSSTTAIATKTEADPEQSYRYAAAGQMIIRVADLMTRWAAQCRRVAHLPRFADCEENARKAGRAVVFNTAAVSDNQETFMAYVEKVHAFERTIVPILQEMEATRLPGER
jgi:hypothetical protein